MSRRASSILLLAFIASACALTPDYERPELGLPTDWLRTQDARRLDAVAGYARLESCRAQHLREYFGEEAGEPCGVCDFCRDRGERPSSFFVPLGKKAFKKKRRRRRRFLTMPIRRGPGWRGSSVSTCSTSERGSATK